MPNTVEEQIEEYQHECAWCGKPCTDLCCSDKCTKNWINER